MGPGPGLDESGKSHPLRDSIPGRPTRGESLYRLSYPGAHMKYYVYENVAKLKYSGITLIYPKCMHDDIQGSLTLGNISYCSVLVTRDLEGI